MNKISKKIVSLVTAAAFALTLVPAAAFAAPQVTAGVALDQSYLAVVNDKGEAQATKDNVETGDKINAEFFVLGNDGKYINNTTALSSVDGDVVFWATTEKDGTYEDASSSLVVTSSNATESSKAANVYYMTAPAVYGTDVTFEFAAAGTYYLHMGVVNTTGSYDDGVKESRQYSTITVEDEATVVDGVLLNTAPDAVFPNGATQADLYGKEEHASTTVTLDESILLPNGMDEYTIKAWAYEHAATTVGVANEAFTLTSNDENLIISDADGVVTTAPDGTFNISFKVAKAGNYRITLHNSDVNYDIYVNYATSNDDIKTVKSNGETLLAGTDTKHYVGDNRPANYSAAVLFEITTQDGGIITGPDAIENEPAHDAGAPNHSTFLQVTGPEGSKIAASDLELVADGEYYTVAYVGDDAARDLIPGEYTVKVSLANGEWATATMTFANYGTTQNVVLDMSAVPSNADDDGYAVQSETITNQVKLGREVTVQAKYVDENGVKINAQDAVYGFDGKAVEENRSNLAANQFETKADVAYNDTFIGSTITVTAVDKYEKELATAELTVVDAYSENTLAFDKTSGLVGSDNNVTVSVVDADGNVVPATGDITAYVEDQSNADADVTVKVAKNMTNGKDGKLILNSDKDTTADIVVSVKAGNAVYAGTLHYTFGECTGVGTSVVMTIGSTETLVNNEIVTIDAAPYVKADRTYVPLRALAQDFGAKVNWDEETNDITVEANGQTIVLKADETTYTVNGEEKTMDVAPELDTEANRVLVPVRFVAEALGYNVTALYAADGTTSCVYFTM